MKTKTKKNKEAKRQKEREMFKKELKQICERYKITIECNTFPGLWGCHLAKLRRNDPLKDIDNLNFRGM